MTIRLLTPTLLASLLLAACTPADATQGSQTSNPAPSSPPPPTAEASRAADETARKIQFIQQIYDDIRQAGIDAADYEPASVRRSPALEAQIKRQAQINAKVAPGELPECDINSPIIPGNGGVDEDFYARRTEVRALDNGLIRAEFSQFKNTQAVDFLVSCTPEHCQIEDEFITTDGTRYSYKEGLESCK